MAQMATTHRTDTSTPSAVLNQLPIECLQSFSEFQLIRDDWEAFMARHYPENYARSHSWLSAWWTTYHHDQPGLIYLQRDPATKAIIAAAPLLIRRDQFGGFPVRSVQTIGSGIGCDDFLIGPESQGFVPAVFHDLMQNRRWELCRLQRSSSPQFQESLDQTLISLATSMDPSHSDDYYITFPPSYDDYHRSRTRKFRRNMNQAMNRLEKEGAVTIELLDPFVDAERVSALGIEVSSTSWQFSAGKSHFNNKGAASFYTNLAQRGSGTGGEEFTVLLVGERPVAYLLGCRKGRTYYAIDTAFHADYRHVSAGRILFSMIFKRLIEQGDVEFFDFEGSGEYKDDYATDSRKAVSLTIYNRTLYPRCIRLLRNSSIYGLAKGFLNRTKSQAAQVATPEQAEVSP